MPPPSLSWGQFPPQWKPPADPEKPPCPYQPDLTLELLSHTAPEPFGHNLYGPSPSPRVRVPDANLKQVTQTRLVVENPPVEAATVTSSVEPRSARLTITGNIAVADARGAQVVACSVELPAAKTPGAKTTTFTAVAKIYDALYYSFANKDFPDKPDDPTWEADMDYSRELGGFAPRYYGSWTFSLPIRHNGKVVTRQVRLILMEKLPGASMRDLYQTSTSTPDVEPNAHHMNEKWRLEVLARFLEGEVIQNHIGVDQRDLAARNIFLVPPQGQTALNPDGPAPRVVLIDYNTSIVWQKTTMGFLPHHYPKAELPLNPMERYWHESLPELWGWWPKEWNARPKLRQQWLVKCFGGSNSAQFAPIEKKLSFTE
ncbi:hypothetical protein KVR01_010326 [Diaporthe batatas]|uniref:uncharacterized protein n=1 Tax=Diaporthe batatas TaxID=748121 RepID=UPI001D04CF2E|nr:uncharacterized protein KVR01_010326 [Diaporthe batatas]KAG8159689.1 hypothetical protein KVR01_010326 [Diaporthe batatas]